MHLYRDNIVFLIAKVHQRSQGVLRKHLQSHGLTPVQCLFLETLWEEDGLPVGEIGRKLTVDTATLTGVLDRMESAGWVRRRYDPFDGRIARIFLTGMAKEAAKDLMACITCVNHELLNKFSHEEKILLKRLLLDLKGGSTVRTLPGRPN